MVNNTRARDGLAVIVGPDRGARRRPAGGADGPRITPATYRSGLLAFRCLPEWRWQNTPKRVSPRISDKCQIRVKAP
jgi:hypothetical protein